MLGRGSFTAVAVATSTRESSVWVRSGTSQFRKVFWAWFEHGKQKARLPGPKFFIYW